MLTLDQFYNRSDESHTPSQEFYNDRITILSALMGRHEVGTPKKAWFELNGIFPFTLERDEDQAWGFNGTLIYTYVDDYLRDKDIHTRPLELLIYPQLYLDDDYQDGKAYLDDGGIVIKKEDHVKRLYS